MLLLHMKFTHVCPSWLACHRSRRSSLPMFACKLPVSIAPASKHRRALHSQRHGIVVFGGARGRCLMARSTSGNAEGSDVSLPMSDGWEVLPSSGAPSAAPAAPVDHSLDPFRALVQDKKFFCTQCGKCCTGSGEVWVSDKEAEGIAGFLNLGMQQFLLRYTKQYKRYKGWHLLKNKGGPEVPCVFLQPDNKCSIHPVRPGQCSTYPWWPELMDRPRWDLEKEHICEGFDHPEAGAVNVEDAAVQLRDATLQEQLRMLSSSRRKKGDA